MDIEQTLGEHVENFTLTANNFVDALLKVAGEFKVPMGIAWVRNESALKKVQLRWKGATVRAIIHDIVSKQEGYAIEVKNGVVHVTPGGLVPDRQNFLGLKIGQFDARNELPVMASRHLHDMVMAAIRPLRPVPVTGVGGIGHSSGVELGEPRISVSLKNAKVQDVLDALCVASPHKIWLVTFTHSKSLTPSGYRRTVSPVDGSAIDDAFQPKWELLKWGRPPY